MIDINTSSSSSSSSGWLTTKSSSNLVTKSFSFLAVFDKNKTSDQTENYVNCLANELGSNDHANYSSITKYKSDYEFMFNDQNKNSSFKQNSLIQGNGKTKLNCTTPYNFKKQSHFKEKIFMLGEIGPFKLNISSDTVSGESSTEENKGNMGECVMKRYISRTVTGWDERGMHYWLHKINKSDLHLPLIDDIIKDNKSWYQINFCEKCISRLKISQNFRDEITYPEDDKSNRLSICSFSEENSEMFDKNKSNCDQNSKIACLNSVNTIHEENEFETASPCSEQYVKRYVYCYNTCGLNIKLFNQNERKNQKKELDEPILNPHIRVIVVGTDPCGLNFPVELNGTESKSNNSQELVTINSENADLQQKESKILKDISSSSGSVTLTQSYSKSNLSTGSNKDNENLKDLYKVSNTSLLHTNSSYDSVSTSTIASLEMHSSSSSCQLVPKAEKKFNLLTYNFLPKVTLNRIHRTFTSLTSIINMNVKCSNNYKIAKCNKQKSKTTTRKVSLSSRVIRNKNHPTYPRTFNISKNRVNAMQCKGHFHCLCCNRLPHKTKSGQHVIQFPKSIAKKIKAIYFKKDCDKILFNSSTSDEFVGHNKADFLSTSHSYFHTILFLTFILFFVFCYVLIIDSMKLPPEPKTYSNWYHY